MNIPMKPGFLYLGETQSQCENPSQAFCVPYATSMPFATNFRAQLQTTASGKVVGQQIGRAIVTQTASWQRYDSQQWWKLNQWIETHGMSFWCHYFDFNAGTWRSREFVCSSISCNPYRPASQSSTNAGEPTYYENCTLTLTDMGG